MKYDHMRETWAKKYNEEKMSIRQIAALEGVTPRTVHQTIQDIITIRPKSSFEEHAEKWLNLYTHQGYSKMDIANAYHTSAGVVGKVLERHGINQEVSLNKLKYAHLSKEWAERYTSGQSYRQIGDAYGGINSETIRQYIVREGIEPRSLSDSIRKYVVNDHYFDEIDSNEKAYCLGLVFGVGSLISSLNSYILNLSCNANTYPIAERIKSALGETSEYKNPKKGEIVIRYSSEHLYKTLLKYGLGESKDTETKFPLINKKLIPSFVLGFWEGRGTFLKNNVRSRYISFSCSFPFLTQLKEIFEQFVDQESIKTYYEKSRNSYKIQVSRISAYTAILDWMYQNQREWIPERVPPFYEKTISDS